MGFIFGGGSETVHVYSTGAIGCTEAGDHGEVLRYKKKRSQLLFRYKKAVSTWKRSAIFLYFVFQYTHTLTHPKKKTYKYLYPTWHALIPQNLKMSTGHILLNLSTCQEDNVLGVS